MQDEDYMRRALSLAKKGEGRTSPNPMVGCVVVKDGRIISEGYHEYYGGFHAERNALSRCKEDTEGADLYVTLEPCCHYGKTPPCTDIIIEKKIRRVFVGCEDCNPLVSGEGIHILRQHGIEVISGVLAVECLKLNEVFYHYMRTKLPFVVMKYAMTLDGKIATETGDSKWVTGEAARRQVHAMRNRYRGIMVGIGTVLKDDPMLNCRIENGKDPVRIVCDSKLQIPLAAQIVKTAKEIPTIVACTQDTFQDIRMKEKIFRLQDAGITIAYTEGRRVQLKQLLTWLGEQGIDSILLEGGGTMNASALQAGIVDKVYAYIAGKMIGGMGAPSPVCGPGAKNMCDAVVLENLEAEKIGEDFCISGYPVQEGRSAVRESGCKICSPD